MIEDRLGRPVRSFSYPHGLHDAAVVAVAWGDTPARSPRGSEATGCVRILSSIAPERDNYYDTAWSFSFKVRTGFGVRAWTTAVAERSLLPRFVTGARGWLRDPAVLSIARATYNRRRILSRTLPSLLGRRGRRRVRSDRWGGRVHLRNAGPAERTEWGTAAPVITPAQPGSGRGPQSWRGRGRGEIILFPGRRHDGRRRPVTIHVEVTSALRHRRWCWALWIWRRGCAGLS